MPSAHHGRQPVGCCDERSVRWCCAPPLHIGKARTVGDHHGGYLLSSFTTLAASPAAEVYCGTVRGSGPMRQTSSHRVDGRLVPVQRRCCRHASRVNILDSIHFSNALSACGRSGSEHVVRAVNADIARVLRRDLVPITAAAAPPHGSLISTVRGISVNR